MQIEISYSHAEQWHKLCGELPHGNIRYAVVPCRLGMMLLAVSNKGLCYWAFADDQESLLEDLQGSFRAEPLQAGGDSLAELARLLAEHLENPVPLVALPLDLRGTAFQQQVWQALREVSVGGTVSYSEIARRIGKPKAVRAVASACAANPVAVLVPCHRIVRKDGSLSGYHWGVWRKRALLAWERDASA